MIKVILSDKLCLLSVDLTKEILIQFSFDLNC